MNNNKKYFKEKEFKIRYLENKCVLTGVETFNTTVATLKKIDSKNLFKYSNSLGNEVFSKMDEVVIIKEVKK